MQVSYEPFLNRWDESYLDWTSDPSMNMYMGVVFVLRDAPSAAWVEGLVRRVADGVPRFKEVAVRRPSTFLQPHWRTDDSFDLARHLRVLNVGPSCPEQLAHAFLHDAYARQIEPTHPQWEWTYISGLQSGRALLMFKVHHMYGDGRGLVLLLREALYGASAAGSPSATKRATAVTAPSALRWAVLEAGRRLAAARKEVTAFGSAVQALRAFVGQAREVATSTADARRSPRLQLGKRNAKRSLFLRRVSFERFKLAAEIAGVSLNEFFVVLAARIVSKHYDRIAHPHERVAVMIPIDVRTEGAQQVVNNQITATIWCAPRHNEILALKQLSAGIKHALQPSGRPMPPLFGALFELLPGAARRWHARTTSVVADLVASNLGAAPVRQLGLSKIDELFLIAPSMGSTATLTFFAYADSACIAVVVNDGVARDVGAFVECLDEELAQFREVPRQPEAGSVPLAEHS